jgi:hypothetical protein
MVAVALEFTALLELVFCRTQRVGTISSHWVSLAQGLCRFAAAPTCRWGRLRSSIGLPVLRVFGSPELPMSRLPVRILAALVGAAEATAPNSSAEGGHPARPVRSGRYFS